jgi:hypothetical protein
MGEPVTGGDMLKALAERYGTNELARIAHQSRIGRTTLENWKLKPEALLREAGRAHYARIFAEDPDRRRASEPLVPYAAGDDLSEVLSRLARIEQRLDSLLKIRDPKRINQMIDAKAREKLAGGSA